MEQSGNADLTEYDASYFVSVVRIMIEGELFKESAHFMEIALQNGECDFEARYFYAFSFFKIGELLIA